MSSLPSEANGSVDPFIPAAELDTVAELWGVELALVADSEVVEIDVVVADEVTVESNDIKYLYKINLTKFNDYTTDYIV